MASLVDEQQQWFDEDTNTPIVSGFIYVGERDASPRTAKAIFSDRELTVALANPQATDSAGRSVNKIWTEGRYSIEVADSDDVQKYIELDNGEGESAGVTTLGDVQGSNTITATASTTITEYTDLQQYVLRTILINTDAVTLNIDSVGAKSIVKNHNEAIQPGNFEATQNVVVTYNSTDDVFEWSNQNLIANSSYKGTDIASASSITIPTDGSYFVLTGSVTVATINVAVDREFTLECSGGLTFTNGSSVISEDSLDVVVEAGGVVMLQSTADNVSQVTKTPAISITLGTPVTSTSGTSIDFTSIPSGTKRITINLEGVSTTGTSIPIIQLGDSGGVESSGYLGTVTQTATSSVSANLASGFSLHALTWVATYTLNGSIVFNLIDASTNTWAAEGAIGLTGIALTTVVGGVKSLTAELDRIRLTTAGGVQTFDAGKVNISYE